MKTYILLVSLFLTVISCKQEDIACYNSNNYLSFSSTVEDTIKHSFFFYQEDEVTVKMQVSLAGLPLDKDKEYKISVIDEESNCPAEAYKLNDKYVFRKDMIIDTLSVIVINQSIFKKESVFLTIQIEDNEHFISSGGLNTKRVIRISDIAQRPDWWTENPIEWWYLGPYSQKKYECFMEATGIGDLTGMSLGDIRILTLKFQHWLDSQNPAIVDEDGNIMKTVIIG
ncbi:MAG: DUF4843 domain-containing protein [Marinifilaceae bacterium]